MPIRRMPTPAGLGVLALTVLAAALRFPTLDIQSFYIDEAYTVAIMFQPGLDGVLSVVGATESTPPLYYLLAWPWAKVFGTGEVGLRSLSALIGTATVPVAYAAGRALVGRRTGMIAAALVAVSPFLVWYSQEARSYVLLVFLATVSVLLFARALDSPSGARVALWAACGALMLATHYFAVFLVVAEGAWLLWATPRSRRRPVALALGGAAAAGVALLPLAVQQQGAARTAWIAAIPMQERLEKVVKEFVTGPMGAPGQGAGAFAFALVLVGAWLLVRRTDEATRRRALVAGGVGAIAVGTPFLLAVAGVDYFLARNLIGAWPLLAVALAAGFAARRWGAAAAVALCAALAAVTLSMPSRPEEHRTDWRGIGELVGPAPATRIVVIAPGWEYVPFKVYRRDAELMAQHGNRSEELLLVGSGDTLAPVPGLASPPGFRLVDLRRVQRMAVLRYRSTTARRVTPAAVRAWGRSAGLQYATAMVQHVDGTTPASAER